MAGAQGGTWWRRAALLRTRERHRLWHTQTQARRERHRLGHKGSDTGSGTKRATQARAQRERHRLGHKESDTGSSTKGATQGRERDTGTRGVGRTRSPGCEKRRPGPTPRTLSLSLSLARQLADLYSLSLSLGGQVAERGALGPLLVLGPCQARPQQLHHAGVRPGVEVPAHHHPARPSVAPRAAPRPRGVPGSGPLLQVSGRPAPLPPPPPPQSITDCGLGEER
jgi:hypothetical protein